MREIALGLLLGIAAGAINQVIVARGMRRPVGSSRRGVLAGVLGGFLVRLAIDAVALVAAWRLLASAAAILAAAGGLLLASGFYLSICYRRFKGGRVE